MFEHLGKALVLLRHLRGMSQGQLARAAGLGKSQLSKYENGQELPKLDSLEKILGALILSYVDLFSALHEIDRRAAGLGAFDPEREGGFPLFAAHPGGKSLLTEKGLEEAFVRIHAGLLDLGRRLPRTRDSSP